MTLEAAYSEVGPKIVAYLVATGTDEATARDLLHDAVVRVVDFTSRKSDGNDLRALLFTTARNLRANRVRDDRRIAFTDSVPEDAIVTDGRSRPVPGDAAYLRGRISNALAALPEPLREAYTLYQMAELSVREIAGLTGASENLVKVRMHRAKLALRRALSDLSGGGS